MRVPVSAPQNVWFDTENVDDDALNLEQNYNNQIQAGIINNHFGSGVLPEVLVQNTLFDTSQFNGLLDGKALFASVQPSDSNEGNLLEVSLLGSLAAGKRAVKILIIGLDFENNLQYDALSFHKNETQITTKHYRTILTILLNDFFGTSTQSFNLGGTITIKETKPLTISRDCIMVSQDVEPNLFFRDFYVSSGGTLLNVLAAALPSYNLDTLNINIGYRQLRSLMENDVSSQIGQKFLATTNNIQKITLLLSTINNTTPSNLIWTGDLLISVYQLQSTVSCPTDLAPGLAIDFDPSNIPIAQLSVDYSALLNSGIQLNTVPQPVDFIFSNTPLGSGLSLSAGNYYMVSIKRAGSADTCQIQLATGDNSSATMRETLFNGSVWVDVPEESLWFQIWTDAAKFSDGAFYDLGHGAQVPKTNIDPNTGGTIDYTLNHIPFVRNDLYYALAQANTTESVPQVDERTGNEILTEKQYTPAISLLNINAVNKIQDISEPLFVGTITDQNVKSYNGALATLDLSFHEYGFVGNKIVLKVITDSTDGYRYDQGIVELVAELVENNLNGAKIIPNSNNPNLYYRVVKAELVDMLYGDVNGDGVIDTNDLLLAQQLYGFDLNVVPSHSQYISQSTLFVNDSTLTWQLINPVDMSVITSGSDGTITVNPNDGTLANFQSLSANFNSISNLGSYMVVISGSISSAGNNGTFAVFSLIDNHDITIKKMFYSENTILDILRADINGDMIVNSDDIDLITDYINLVPPFPSTTSPANKIGTSFNAIVLTVEKYIDRADDYPASDSNRENDIHPIPDIYLDGYEGFSGQNLKLFPLDFSIVKQLVWDDYDVVSTSNPRYVPAAFNYRTGQTLNNCGISGTTNSQEYPNATSFDPGRNDLYLPNNLVIADGGQIITPDGYGYKIDYEIGNITFEIPAINFTTEKTVNIFTDFVCNYSKTGYTRIGYPSMKFSDCSDVTIDALTLNQVRFEASLVSFSPLLQGIAEDGYTCIDGIIIDNKIGIFLDTASGLITFNFDNLFQDPVLQTLTTKVNITVHLKKAGWLNTPIFISSNKTTNLLTLTPTVFPDVDCPDPAMIVVS